MSEVNDRYRGNSSEEIIFYGIIKSIKCDCSDWQCHWSTMLATLEKNVAQTLFYNWRTMFMKKRGPLARIVLDNSSTLYNDLVINEW